MIKIIVLLIVILTCNSAYSQTTLVLHPTIHSIGIEVIFPERTNIQELFKAELYYRENGGTFKKGYDPTLLTIDSMLQLRGSVFLLNANTEYDVKVILQNHIGVLVATLNASTRTLNEPNIISTSIVKYVSPSGIGTEYSLQNPGNLQVLLAGQVECGTTVLLKGGTYDVGDMYVRLTQNCTENKPIVILRAPNEIPILDGGDYKQYTWIQTPEDTLIYTTTTSKDLEYNGLMLLDSIRLYPYPFLKPPEIQSNYPSLSNLGYDISGFYRKGNVVYCKTLDHKNPNLSRVVFSKRFTCLSIDGNGKNNFLHVKGITFQNYGKGKCDVDIFGNPVQCYPSFTLQLFNSNYVTIDSCIFIYTNFPITFNGSCSRNKVQNCKITDQTGWWSHGAFKQSRQTLYLEPGSYGRYLENGGISLSPSDGGIFRDNVIQNNVITGVVVGISVGGSTPNYRIYDTDISGNTISYCYDAIDVTAINTNSGCINSRIWGNEVHHIPVAFSLIQPQWGPTTIFRNVAHHISERKNHNFDVFFADCDNSLSEKSWGTGLKVNTGEINPNPGYIFLFHNTFHSIDELGFSMYLWKSTWKNLISRNNIYYSEGKSSLFYDDIFSDSLFSFNSLGDNFWNTRSGNIATIQPKNGIPTCYNILKIKDLESKITDLTRSPFVTISGFTLSPYFTNNHDFQLSTNSPLIDKAVLLPGINDDYQNNAPDIGAFESMKSTSLEEILDDTRTIIYPNPFSTSATIISSKPIHEILIVSVTGVVLENRILHNDYTFTWENIHTSGSQILTIFFVDGSILRKILLSYQ